MSNRFVIVTTLALAAVGCLIGQVFAQKKAGPTARSVKVGDKETQKLNKPLKPGVNKIATLKTGEEVFVRLKGNKVVEMFAQDKKGKKTTASSLEERKLEIKGTIRICGTIFKQRVCVTIDFGAL
jgi:hypothetical protein